MKMSKMILDLILSKKSCQGSYHTFVLDVICKSNSVNNCKNDNI